MDIVYPSCMETLLSQYSNQSNSLACVSAFRWWDQHQNSLVHLPVSNTLLLAKWCIKSLDEERSHTAHISNPQGENSPCDFIVNTADSKVCRQGRENPKMNFQVGPIHNGSILTAFPKCCAANIKILQLRFTLGNNRSLSSLAHHHQCQVSAAAKQMGFSSSKQSSSRGVKRCKVLWFISAP